MPLPWPEDTLPVMLAPMQGLTNRGIRDVFANTVRPDVVFTEFVRVKPRSKRLITQADLVEACTPSADVPLVVQVIGSAEDGVVEATRELVARGVQHINVNMGCPFGRMTSVLAGGGMFKHPETIEPMLAQLRALVPGSLSVKTRLGIEDPRKIFEVLPAFESAGVDFMIIHSRTVKQKYTGGADHDLTRELVETSALPVIANGDVCDEGRAAQVMAHTNAAGLMLGRGAISDPRLFERIRGKAPARPSGQARRCELAAHLFEVLRAYEGLFCGDAQVLSEFRQLLVHVPDPELGRWIKGLKKKKRATEVLNALAADLA